MTEAELRQKPVDYLKQYLDIKEGSTQHKAIIQVFNDSGLCSRYKMTVYDAWCATAASAAFIASGLTAIFPCVECSCPAMISKAQSAGIWVENDAYIPKVGDVIMYDWDDSGYGDNTGSADHVGIVASVSGNTMTIIEGNKNDTVAYRTMQVNGRYIRGYITPKFSSMATATTPSTTVTTTTSDLKTNKATVQKRFGFTDSTINYLSKHSSPKSLFKKLADTSKKPVTPKTKNLEGYKAATKKRFDFGDSTIQYLMKHGAPLTLFKRLALMDYGAEVKKRFSFTSGTIRFLAKHGSPDALFAKLANTSRKPVAPATKDLKGYKAAVKKRFGFTDATMTFLAKHKSPKSLFKKLATKK